MNIKFSINHFVTIILKPAKESYPNVYHLCLKNMNISAFFFHNCQSFKCSIIVSHKCHFECDELAWGQASRKLKSCMEQQMLFRMLQKWTKRCSKLLCIEGSRKNPQQLLLLWTFSEKVCFWDWAVTSPLGGVYKADLCRFSEGIPRYIVAGLVKVSLDILLQV